MQKPADAKPRSERADGIPPIIPSNKKDRSATAVPLFSYFAAGQASRALRSLAARSALISRSIEQIMLQIALAEEPP